MIVRARTDRTHFGTRFRPAKARTVHMRRTMIGGARLAASEVPAIDPIVSMRAIGNPGLKEKAGIAADKLRAAMGRL